MRFTSPLPTSAWRWLLVPPAPGWPHSPHMLSRPCLLPGTKILERASGWLSVSTLTCRNARHSGLCRCLRTGAPVSSGAAPPDSSLGCGRLILAVPETGGSDTSQPVLRLSVPRGDEKAGPREG